MTHKRYLVCGHRRYRNHEPGAVFEARLDPDAERRAIERGNIRVLDIVEADIGTFAVPKDWPQPAADKQPDPIGRR